MPIPRHLFSPTKKVVLDCSDSPSLTKQQFVAECDINTILKQFQATGLIEHLAQANPIYGDATTMADFQEAQNLIAEANSSFYGLPSLIRDRFSNSPAEFLGFMENPANAAEAISLGLATAIPTPPAGASGVDSVVPNLPESGG